MNTKFYYNVIDTKTGETTGLLVTKRQRNEAQYVLTNIQPRSLNLAYNYAEIDLDTGECTGVMSSSFAKTGAQYIPIPSYNEDYLEKYYLNGQWYEDAAGTIPWSPEA